MTTAASNSGLGADASNASMHEETDALGHLGERPPRVRGVAPLRQTAPLHVPGVPFLAAITSHTTTAALRPLSLFSLDPARPSSSRRLFTPDRDQVFPDASRSRPVTVVCQWAVTSSPASAPAALADRLIRGHPHEHLVGGEQLEEVLPRGSHGFDPALGDEHAVEGVEGAEDAVPARDVPFSLELLAHGLGVGGIGGSGSVSRWSSRVGTRG